MDEITIREVGQHDLAVILHHRRGMFEDMGYQDVAALDAMVRTCRPFFAQALAEGWYRGWLAQNAGGGVVAGGGILILSDLAQERNPVPTPRRRRPRLANRAPPLPGPPINGNALLPSPRLEAMLQHVLGHLLAAGQAVGVVELPVNATVDAAHPRLLGGGPEARESPGHAG